MRPITERLSPVVKALVVVEALLFAFYLVVNPSRIFFHEHLALGPGALHGELWQLFTALVVHIDGLSFFFNIIGLWFVGATVERAVGTRRFLTLFLVSGVAANVVMLLLSVALGEPALIAGSGRAVLALFVAFGALFDRTPLRVLGGLVLEARVMTAILVGFSLLADVTQGYWAGLGGSVVAVILGYLLAGGRGSGLRSLWGGLRAKRVRRRYQVIEGGRDKGSQSSRPPYLN
jgi:membrane associated rhomboid family serine protease